MSVSKYVIICCFYLGLSSNSGAGRVMAIPWEIHLSPWQPSLACIHNVTVTAKGPPSHPRFLRQWQRELCGLWTVTSCGFLRRYQRPGETHRPRLNPWRCKQYPSPKRHTSRQPSTRSHYVTSRKTTNLTANYKFQYEDGCLSSGLLHRIVWKKLTDVSEMLPASTTTSLHGATSKKTDIFILATVRTWNLTQNFSNARRKTTYSRSCKNCHVVRFKPISVHQAPLVLQFTFCRAHPSFYSMVTQGPLSEVKPAGVWRQALASI
jgi:hypothetical protein